MHKLTSHHAWMLILGIAVITFGIISGRFYPGLIGSRSERSKPLPPWFGRLWFLLCGAWLIWLSFGPDPGVRQIPGFILFAIALGYLVLSRLK